tara:strand:- start:1106 stop:1528 length:423 start_codon:yes stop_codon:yes gene_type:complete
MWMIDKEIKKKYENHHLFKNCISISFPKGWNAVVEEIVQFLEYSNRRIDFKILVTQIKTKFGLMVVYLEPELSESGDAKSYEQFSQIAQKVDEIANKSFRMCKICGKNLVKTVVDSKITVRCLEHFDVNQGDKNLRSIRL